MSNNPWLTEISYADIAAAMQRKAAREARIETQAAEITRLRAELATARCEAMEDAAKIAWDYAERLEDMAELSRYSHVKREHEGRSWVAQTIAAAIRAAAAKEDRPSEEIIREDRDAWPDRQANDPIRAAAKEGK